MASRRGGASQVANVSAADELLVRRSAPATRNLRTAVLRHLPPLPDTSEELEAIASALGDRNRSALYLRANASKQNVRRESLDRFRVVAFASHGLLPGDLDGLTQPAIALTPSSSPEDDGLLRLDDIVQLRLAADWVLLSACNTAVGARAAHSLGRAFFYAGARALLATQWPVHSTSARDLTIGIFEAQRRTPGLGKAMALRESALRMIASGAQTDSSGRARFAYAHPMFWAPYVIIGDGG